MRVLLVTNPSSGGAKEDVTSQVRDALLPLGDVIGFQSTSREGFDAEVLAATKPDDLIVVAGGDGTFNCTVNALEDRLDEVRLALVPLGTGNDLARTLRLPTDPIEAARGLVEGRDIEIDVGRAEGPGVRRLFVNACMGGFPVQVTEALDEGTKARFGPAAFVVGGAKALGDLERSTVTIDDVVVDDCVAAGVGNGRTCGGGIEVWPDARPDDGVLEGCALGAGGILSLARLATKVKAATHQEMDEVKTTRGPRIEIDADPPIEINVDGELVGLSTPATFELVRKLRMRIPSQLD